MLHWPDIHSVFLDMDGTLLDLYFDNHFWREHVPLRYAEQRGLDLDTAKQELLPRFRSVEGTMAWYCLDHWSRELDLDILELKREVEHLIAVHPHVIDFLDAVRIAGKRVVLVTNAHNKSLSLKMERTRLAGHFDAVICSHDFGKPKEDPAFWTDLAARETYNPAHTLLVDDSLPVLRAARRHGIAHLLAILRPDSREGRREVSEFPAIDDFSQIMPE